MYFKLLTLTAFMLLSACYQRGSPSQNVEVARQPIASEFAPQMSVSASDGLTTADFEQHISRLKTQLPKNEFTLVAEPPFVVVGDETPQVVRQRAADTVRWTVRLLKKDYFTKDPPEIIDIFLFKDTASYERNARAIFNDEPDTPYGYYSSAHRALIMNIETGSGTLVHEIVHPFIEANFPACPSWFNEGLASLYEQSGEVDGHLHGFPNWRLPGLQRAIRAGAVPAFKTLFELQTEAFYHQDKGTNYAQSRYLCYYLQERGLLVKFYREFTANQAVDPTGYLSLCKVLGESDLRAFQKKWEKFVLDLRQGYSITVVE